MSLQSLGFWLFLPITALIDLHLPVKWQNPFLAAASLLFYFYNLPSDPAKAAVTLAALAGVCVFVYALALAIGRAEKASARQKRLVRIGVICLLCFLAVFKYWNLSPLPALLSGTVLQKLPFPLGISFFTFAAIGYLVDVGRGDVPAENSFVRVFLFLFFFGTITSGPICRAGSLMPQLAAPRRFERERTVNALRLFALGLWKKMAISDVLALCCNQVFADISGHGGPMLLFAVFGYTLILYFDFSGYSDMARATGLALGLELPENFKTPFFATNFSGFWSRWHISLSSWLQDYLFTPLVWADTSRLPFAGSHLSPLFCVFCVFFFSGFWHGSTLPFVVWGFLQAAYRVGEELMHQHLGRPKKKAPARVQWAKRAGVFVLWSFSMVFFRVGSGPDTKGLGDAFAIIRGWGCGWGLHRFASELISAVSAGFYADPRMIAAYMLFVIFGIALAFRLDWLRFKKFKSKPSEQVLAAQKPAVRWLLYYILVISILVGLIIQNGGFGGGVSFSYANF